MEHKNDGTVQDSRASEEVFFKPKRSYAWIWQVIITCICLLMLISLFQFWNANEKLISEVSKNIEKGNNTILGGIVDNGSKFDDINKKVDGVDKKVDDVSKRIFTVSKKVEAVNRQQMHEASLAAKERKENDAFFQEWKNEFEKNKVVNITVVKRR